MIKQILSKLFSQKPKDIECAIDEDKVDCEHLDDDQDKAYVGVPAPILNPVDEWFSSSYGCPGPVITKKQEDYMEQETLIKQHQCAGLHLTAKGRFQQKARASAFSA